MKKTNILITASAALVALVAVVGLAVNTYAQTASNSNGKGDQAMQAQNRMQKWQNLSDEEKQEMEDQRETRRAEMDAKRQAIDSAMDQGYDAWVNAVKTNMGEDAPILDQVNADNFSKFAEAHGHMEQARQIFDEIGVKQGFGRHGGMMGEGGCRGASGR